METTNTVEFKHEIDELKELVEIGRKVKESAKKAAKASIKKRFGNKTKQEISNYMRKVRNGTKISKVEDRKEKINH